MKDKPDEIKGGKDGDADTSDETSQLNSPELNEETGKVEKKAISSYKQAHGISKRIYDKAKDGRIRTAAVIADKYGGSPPYEMAALRKTGQTWRNNFSTNPLGSVVDRSTPQLTDPVKQAEYLTYSALPADREDAADKTRKFRLRTTKLVRSWPGFQSLICQCAQDDYLYGNSAPGWIDDDWRPRGFRYDEIFLPEGTGQHASQVQFVIYRQPMLLHDFLEKLKDKEVAKAAGYDLEGCYKSANEASGLRANGDMSQLEQVDAVREGGTLGYTYDGETKVVWMFHLIVREYDGPITIWTTSQKGGHAIRKVEMEDWESMEDACCLFTLQEGNGKYYGSKGAGRLLTNLAIALDRTRNHGMDLLYMSGMPVLKTTNKNLNTVLTTVRTPFIVVGDGAEIVKEGISFDREGYEFMDTNLNGIMNEIAGAFIPPHTESDSGGANTKIEAAQKAERELAVKNGVLGRWFGQFANLIGGMQRKIYRPDNLKEGLRLHEENKAKQEKGIRVMAKRLWEWLKGVVPGMDKNAKPEEISKVADADAVQAIVDLLNDGLSIEDIAELALSPAGNNVEEQPEEQDAKTVQFIQGMQGTPIATQFNLREQAKMLAEITVGQDRANRLLLPDAQDPNVESVQNRNQIQEWVAMDAGYPQGVASEDNHAIHRQTMLPLLQPIIQSLTVAPTPEMLGMAKLALQHYADHLAADQEMPPEAKAPEEKGIQDWQKAIVDAEKALADLAAQAEAAGVQGGAGALPPGVNGQPMTAEGPDGALAGTNGDLEREKLLADTQLRTRDQDIKQQQLDLKAEELRAKQESEATDRAMRIMQSNADKEAEAIQRGIEHGRADLERQAAASNPDKAEL